MTSWTDIHKDFDKKEYSWSDKTCQQEWEEANITKEEAKGWIELGFIPYDLYLVKKWKNLNFSPTETKAWLEVGLDKGEEDFAFWLITKNCSPELVKNNLKQLRNDYENLKINNSQTWLEQVYHNHNIKELDISGKNLKGKLNLSQYQQLEILWCFKNELTNIILPAGLKELYLRDNNFNRDLSFLVPCANLELDINDFNLDKLNIQEDPQEQSSTQAQIQQPPKQ